MSILQKLLVLCVCFLATMTVFAQKKVTFDTSDGVSVTADLYRIDKYDPYIILLHDDGSSRGQYREIAPKLEKIGFNCLAVDLRCGKESNYVRNETAADARAKGASVSMADCEKDIEAAITYLSEIAIQKHVILMGSTFSASLAMKEANNNPQVTAVMAFSPGEYFDTPISAWVKDFTSDLYVTATMKESPYVKKMLANVSQNKITLFSPKAGAAVQGAPILDDEGTAAGECWLSLMLFLNRIKETKY